MVVDSVDQGLKGFSKETAEGTELELKGNTMELENRTK